MPSKQENPITKEGFQKIQEELHHLIKVEREELKKAIANAREHGDLKENAEYHAAKEKQAHVEGRIARLQDRVIHSKVIDPSLIKSEKILFGATVILLNQKTDEISTYQIVGNDESDTSQGKISLTSPLGRALMGKEEGDISLVKAPKGEIEYEIQSVTYK